MAKSSISKLNIEQLFGSIKQVIEESRNSIYRSANVAMVQAYWHIGKLIVKEEQNGKERATYGEELIKKLSEKLSSVYGKGFTETNLKYMRRFYSLFEKGHAVRGELSWTHYRLLLNVEKEETRQFYMQEAIEGNWNTRTLERDLVETEKRLKK